MNSLSQMHCRRVNASTPPLEGDEISSLSAELPGWKTASRQGELRLEKSFPFKDFNQPMAFSNQLARLAEEEDHHPALLTEWGKVTVTWWTHRIKGLHLNDFIMAAKTDELMQEFMAKLPTTLPDQNKER